MPGKVMHTVTSLLHYPAIAGRLRRVRSELFFIFPSWQIGGSERVHIAIMATVSEKAPTCLITEPQDNVGLKREFAKYAQIIYLRRWGTKASFKPRMLKQVAAIINRQPKALVFGSNNLFFYDLIPYLASHVSIVDLTHSITPKLEWCETYSLPYVPRINHRVVLGPKTLETFQSIYKNHGVPPQYLDRFRIIPNQTSAPPALPPKAVEGPLEILFVARNSEEKRPGVFFRIVDACLNLGIGARFTVIGDFEDYRQRYNSNVHFTGVLRNEAELAPYYRKAHLILITSRFEGFPMVLLEGMAYGVVPLCTAVGEIPHFISTAQKTGFTVENRHSDELLIDEFVNLIRKIAAEKNSLTTFSKGAYRLVKESFSKKRFRSAYRAFLIQDPSSNAPVT